MDQTGADENCKTIGQIGPGELVGEMALLGGTTRSAIVIALYHSHLVRLPGRAIGIVSPAATLSPCDVAVEQKSLLWLLMGGRNKAPSMAQVLRSSGMTSCGYQRAAARSAADVLVQPSLNGIGILSFRAIDQAVEAGYRAMQAAMPTLRMSGNTALPGRAGLVPCCN